MTHRRHFRDRDRLVEPFDESSKVIGTCYIRRVTSGSDRDAVYRLRYNCYLREGAIKPSRQRRLFDNFDNDPDTWIFAVTISGELVASIRVRSLTYGRADSPTYIAFREVIDPLLRAGNKLLDPSRLVVDRAASQKNPSLIFAIMHIPLCATLHFDCNFALAAVRREHMAFYRRYFGFTRVADERPYPQLTKPLGLMIGNASAAALSSLPWRFNATSASANRLFASGLQLATSLGDA